MHLGSKHDPHQIDCDLQPCVIPADQCLQTYNSCDFYHHSINSPLQILRRRPIRLLQKLLARRIHSASTSQERPAAARILQGTARVGLEGA